MEESREHVASAESLLGAPLASQFATREPSRDRAICYGPIGQNIRRGWALTGHSAHRPRAALAVLPNGVVFVLAATYLHIAPCAWFDLPHRGILCDLGLN